jgi:hypothetical protein
MQGTAAFLLVKQSGKQKHMIVIARLDTLSALILTHDNDYF